SADPASRQKAYLEVQQLLLEEVPVAWLHEINFPTLYRSRVKNPISSGIGLNDGISRAWLG
ncbi:MAG: ABC transporter substrate-binding protein, partial [Aquincola sp.]|nr:ABC transporter substrate-binding protein [Aquincola sp.]